jgi:RHS repeat-associated protein
MPVEYNTVGKQVRDYLPVPQPSTSGGAFYDSPFSAVPALYGNEKIYAEKIYDPVYTDRIKQVVSVGSAWAQKPVSLGMIPTSVVKLKSYLRGAETLSTDYLDGFQYSFYTGPNPPLTTSGLKFVPTSEGYYDFENNAYIYHYTDHLGNVRLSYTDTNKDGIIQPRQYHVQQCDGPWDPWNPPNCIDYWKPGEIVEANTYYPFGLLHNYTATTQNAYQYKYNGKELQETGMYDYGSRMYMPDLGRWGVVGPLAETFRRWPI